ncbi:hypothetical protein CBER1_06189 [Cercospora berteroae]|uniref:Uncharacterized protein n=1 Tax=Cercospora berteroae TaxID=357750 RepID=A0A2S6C4G0_9PEZI|nr:hypothetical protein CBER1_06189 [Cercospora berteroae]
MKPLPTTLLLALFSTPLTTATLITYDAGYDDPTRPLTAIACSTGPNGLMTTHNWYFQSEIPSFPFMGGSADIEAWNSEFCGQCYQVTYGENTIYVLGIDRSARGLNLSKAAMDALMRGLVVQEGTLDAVVVRVGGEYCGLVSRSRWATMEFDK